MQIPKLYNSYLLHSDRKSHASVFLLKYHLKNSPAHFKAHSNNAITKGLRSYRIFITTIIRETFTAGYETEQADTFIIRGICLTIHYIMIFLHMKLSISWLSFYEQDLFQELEYHVFHLLKPVTH